MKWLKLTILVGVFAGWFAVAIPQSVRAQAEEPYMLIEQVNALRAEYGLPPYRINPALMAAAQVHTEWAASVGYHSHVGPDGSRPRDRAVVQGYGGGAQVYVSENIYWSGGNPTTTSAITWWRNSDIHFKGMTSSFYTEIGAGIAYNGSSGYYTLLFGVVTGEVPAAGSSAGMGATGESADEPQDSTDYVQPIQVATPGPDGAVVHQVQEGQFLIKIAEAYGVELADIMSLNGLNQNSIIYPGDQLIIRNAAQPSPTPSMSLTETPGGTEPIISTRAPTMTPTPLVAADSALSNAASADPDPEPLTQTQAVESIHARTVLTFVLSACIVLGVILIGVGMRLRSLIDHQPQQTSAWYEWE